MAGSSVTLLSDSLHAHESWIKHDHANGVKAGRVREHNIEPGLHRPLTAVCYRNGTNMRLSRTENQRALRTGGLTARMSS